MIGGFRIGVEIGPRTVRAVRVTTGGWSSRPAQVVEIEGDPATPRDVVATLRDHFGPPAHVAVAFDLPLLCVKQVRLPPLAAAEKRRILSLEPERFFAIRGDELVVVTRDEDNLVFATREESVTSWVTALEELAPVEIVEPGPAALARALTRAGVSDAAVLREGRDHGVGLLVLNGGRIARARRVYGGLREAARALRDEPSLPERVLLSPWSEDAARVVATELGRDLDCIAPLPAFGGVSPQFLPALGVVLALEQPPPPDNSLAPTELAERIGRRRRREMTMAVAAGTAALVLALSSADAWRGRAVTQLQSELPALRERAAPALALQSEIQSVQQEAQTIRAVTLDRPEPLRVLSTLTRRLPAGAYVRSLRFAGSDWQIDGYAPNAARVLAELGGTSEFTDVRFVTATTRVLLGSRTYETFALAFRFAAAR